MSPTLRTSCAAVALAASMAAFLAWPGESWADTGTTVRVGDHAGFGRVVFDLPDGASVTSSQDGNQVRLVFKGAGLVAQPVMPPGNVLLVLGGQDAATIVLAPGARGRVFRLENRLIVDVLDPPGRSRPSSASAAAPSTSTPSTTVPSVAPVPAGSPVIGPAPYPAPVAAAVTTVSARREMARPIPLAGRAIVPAPTATPTLPVPADEVTAAPVVPVTVEPLAPPGLPAQAVIAPVAAPPAEAVVQPPSPAFVLQVPADVGVAAFRRGGTALIVLDRRLPPQVLPDGATWAPSTASTLISLPLESAASLHIERVAAGWSVQAVPGPVEGTLSPVPGDGGMRLAAPRPGGVATMLDPGTGGTLLVGTVLDGGAGAAVGIARQTADMTLLRTWLGVAILPAADLVDLRATTRGFVVAGAAAAAVAAEASQTRRFDLPALPTDRLLNRLRAQQAGAAASDPRARSHERVGAARSMIALGMGAEAQSLLLLVASDDPQAASDAEVTGLTAVAAVLAGRPGEAGALDDRRLDGTDEIALWRGLRDRLAGNATDDAARLGCLIPLARSYPDPLRRSVWPAVAEAAVEAGMPIDAGTLPAFAKALALERAGKLTAALAAYDALADGRDRLDGVRAKVRAVEARLASGSIGAKAAAILLDRAAFDWRGDRRELAMRLRATELMAAAGDWRAALDMLRSAAAAFPEAGDAVRAGKAAVLQSMLASEGAGLSPLDAVLLAGEFGDAVPDGAAGGALARLLADKLMALDLPARAVPVLQGLMRAAPAGEPRAEFGARLAQLLLDGGAPASAAEALDASDAPGLTPTLTEARILLGARVKAALGDTAAARVQLEALGTAPADELRASLARNAGDWAGSLAALNDLAAKRVPAEGPLTDAAQDILVQQASAAAQVPDGPTLRTLSRSAGRLTGSRAELFRVLTDQPVATTRDLARAGQDLATARLVAQRMGAGQSR